MATRKVNWEGSYPALVTPFTKEGAIDEKLLRANVNLAVDEGSHGIVICGHNGEAHLMTAEERKRVLAIAVETNNGRVPLIAGTGGIRTEDVIRHTKDAKDVGAVGAMIEPPYFMRAKDGDLIAHYAEISDAVDMPIMLYNCPSRSGTDMKTDLIEKTAEQANIVAIKDACHIYERMMEMLQRFGDRINIFIGPQGIWGFAGVVMGAMGYVDGMQQVAGRDGVVLYDYAKARDYKRGVPLQHKLLPLRTLSFESDGTAPSTLKDAMRLLGRPGGWPRKPLRAQEGESLKKFERKLREYGFLNGAAAAAE